MKQNLKFGRVAGISVGAQWSALVIVGLIALTLATGVLPDAAPGHAERVYWMVAVPGAAVFLLSLLAHELAHSLVAKHYGLRIDSITLWMLGGISELEDEAPTPQADFAIAAAGPATSFVLGALFTGAFLITEIFNVSPLLVQTLAWLGIMNVILAVFNLLPGAPLDGGRVLRAVLWRRYHDQARADLAAAHAGRTLGFTLGFLGLLEFVLVGVGGLWLVFIGWFLVTAAKAETNARIVRQVVSGVRVDEVMTPQPDCAPAWQDIETFVEHTFTSSRQNAFPVLDFDGAPIGVITADQVSRLPLETRQNQLIRSITLPLPARNVFTPDASATDLFSTPPVAGRVVAVVVDSGRVIGMVTTEDLSLILRRGLLQRSTETD